MPDNPLLPPLTPPRKCVVGIDIAKDTFVACLGQAAAHQPPRFGKETSFANTPAGFAQLCAWVGAQAPLAQVWFVVEATGVYYEELAYFLADQALPVSVLLPNKVKYYAQSTEQKSKTDQLDARLLCRLGLERVLPAWHPPTPALRQLRSLARERHSLARQVAQLQARQHAYAHSYQPDERTQQRLRAQRDFLRQQVRTVEADIAALLAAEPELGRKVALLTGIPGLGQLTAVAVVAETQGFALVENERQLASYAGLDVVQRQSGLTAKATRISKRGNVRLRTALYMAAVSSTRHNPQQAAFYTRLRARQPSGKPGVVAVMRKLLLLCHALWKTDRPYDPEHPTTPGTRQKVAPAQQLAEATQDEPQAVLLKQAPKVKKVGQTLAS